MICDECKEKVDDIYLTEYVPNLAPMLALCFDCDNDRYPSKPIVVLSNYRLFEEETLMNFTGIYIMEESP